MKIKRTRTISHLLFAMIATASASGVLSPVSVQAQDSNGTIVCKVIDDDTKSSLTCLMCETSFWYRLFNPWRCSGCTKPYAPTW